MGRTHCWHKNQGLQLIKWILWCWALKNVSIKSSQQRDSVIFIPSLCADSRAQGLATLGTTNRNGGSKGGGFRKHNQGLTLRNNIAQVLVEYVGAEPVVCWASSIGVKSDLLDWLKWTGVVSLCPVIPTVFSRTCVSVNKFIGLHCASTYLANVWGKRDERMTVWFLQYWEFLPFYFLLLVSAEGSSPSPCWSTNQLLISVLPLEWVLVYFLVGEISLYVYKFLLPTLSFVLISSKQSVTFNF